MSERSSLGGHNQTEPVVEGLLRLGPRLVERTRRQAEFALVVLHGLRRLGEPRRSASTRADDNAVGDTPSRAEPVSGSPSPTVLDQVARTPPPTQDESSTHASTGSAGGSGAHAPGAGPATDEPTEAELAIDSYDSLAASHVVPRLVTLSPDELRSIQRYEQAGRRRQTVLTRIEQLLADR